MILIPTQKKIGLHLNNGLPALTSKDDLKIALKKVCDPIYVVEQNGKKGVIQKGSVVIGDTSFAEKKGLPLFAFVPPVKPDDLGDTEFKKAHGINYAYIAGAMANGITSVEMVKQIGKAGMLGFFGSAGLSLSKISSAIDALKAEEDNYTFGFNLIHSPNDPGLEMETVKMFLEKKVRRISASAYMSLSLPLILYRIKGIHRSSNGEIVCPNYVFAKVSRAEVAQRFFSPPHKKLIQKLRDQRLITEDEANLAAHIPVARDLTAEADSGGHTDNRPALALLPTMMALRDKMQAQYNYVTKLRVGLGGGIATPESTAAAFSMGAAYVLTGSVNQSCVEAGISETVRQMLAETRQADVTMAPAADMFEMGVKVQVLKRGTMFPLRAAKLYEFYRSHNAFDEIPHSQQAKIEKDFFKCTFEDEWEKTRSFFHARDPRQIERAEKDPKHKMALVFRAYLGKSSRWAVTGDSDRRMDYQVWCGPAMGAFNEWVKGSFLELPENRKVAVVAMNLLFGATIIMRLNWLRSQQVLFTNGLDRYEPMPLNQIQAYLNQ